MTCMPPSYSASFLGNNVSCTVGGFPEYSINVTSVAQIQLAVNIARELNLRLVIKNTGHDFGAKSTGRGGLNIWTHHLKDSEFYPEYKAENYTGPAFKLAAGIQVLDANRLAKEHGVTLVGGEGIVSSPSFPALLNRSDFRLDCRLHRWIHTRWRPLTTNLDLRHGC